jgi:hypothetical protein
MRRSAALLTLFTALACKPPNPAVPPPTSAQLAGGGVWVAYNLGCDQGCDQISRGDRILAVEGKPISSGAEFDAADIDRGTPVPVTVAKHGGGAPIDVTVVAKPHTDMPPLKEVPPLLTIGAAALDRAPEWARLRLFGHAIPALRLYRGEEPRGYINGREMYGRGAVILVWELPWLISHTRELWNELPKYYAQLQRHDPALQAAGVDTYFVFPSADESRKLRPEVDPNMVDAPVGEDSLRFAINEETRAHIRSQVPAGTSDLIPLFLLESAASDPNNIGLEHQASDLREWLFDRIYAPVIVVIDHRGIVRFHTRDFPIGPEETIEAAVQFALTQLPDGPTPGKPATTPAATPAAAETPAATETPAAPPAAAG